MELWIAIILDIIAATIVIVPIILGIIRGFKRQLLALLSLAVSAAAAYACATYLTTPVYNGYIKSGVTDACAAAIENADPVSYADRLLAEQGISVPEEELREKLAESGDALAATRKVAEENGLDEAKAKELSEKLKQEYLADVPDEVKDAAPKALKKLEGVEIDDGQIVDLLNAAVTSPQEGGEYAEEHFIRPTAKSVLKVTLFMAAFIVMKLFMRLLYFIIGIDMKEEPYGAGSRFAGFLLGVICGAGNLAILCVLVSFLEKASFGLFSIDTLPSKVFLPIFQLIF